MNSYVVLIDDDGVQHFAAKENPFGIILTSSLNGAEIFGSLYAAKRRVAYIQDIFPLDIIKIMKVKLEEY